MQRTPPFALSALALTGAWPVAWPRHKRRARHRPHHQDRDQPFFVKMKGRHGRGQKLGAKLVSAAGKTDGDNAGQVTAMENLIAAGAKTILITPATPRPSCPPSRRRRRAA